MIKTVCLTLALLLISTGAYAQKVIKLNPKESKSLTNTALWTLNANCHIAAHQTTDVIKVSVTENKGQVNGKSLSKGQATLVKVKNEDNISVTAEPGTTVNIVNMSTDSVEADCSA